MGFETGAPKEAQSRVSARVRNPVLKKRIFPERPGRAISMPVRAIEIRAVLGDFGIQDCD